MEKGVGFYREIEMRHMKIYFWPKFEIGREKFFFLCNYWAKHGFDKPFTLYKFGWLRVKAFRRENP
jgi:hypothetical protein